MERVYRGFETSLLALSLGLGLAALASLGPGRPLDSAFSVTLLMLSVSVAR